jgi:putative glutamine amidotransferase
LHAIIFSGGEDVDPARQAAHARTEVASAERDTYEAALVRAAYERRLPTLAICRGVQIANVAFGGSLHQHVPDIFGAAIAHQPQVDGATYRGIIAAHRVAVDAVSRFAQVTGTSFATGSRHHQSLDRIAEPFRVVGRTPDGVVEALESVDAERFWFGVQWHPESTLALDDGESRKLFAALVSAARRPDRV